MVSLVDRVDVQQEVALRHLIEFVGDLERFLLQLVLRGVFLGGRFKPELLKLLSEIPDLLLKLAVFLLEPVLGVAMELAPAREDVVSSKPANKISPPGGHREAKFVPPKVRHANRKLRKKKEKKL